MFTVYVSGPDRTRTATLVTVDRGLAQAHFARMTAGFGAAATFEVSAQPVLDTPLSPRVALHLLIDDLLDGVAQGRVLNTRPREVDR